MVEHAHRRARVVLVVEDADPGVRKISRPAERSHPLDVARLLEVASEAASPLSASEIDEAIAHHPRIGEKPVGDGAAQAFSRNEQAGLGSDEDDLATAIATGNVAYERRFGRVFIIRAAGRSRAEILAELERRLELPNSSELKIVGEQLRDIALLRIENLWAVPAGGDRI